MIKFIVKYDNEKCSYFELSGHSGYAKEGFDIVCSSVTTAAYTTLNLLDKLNSLALNVEGENAKGYLHVDIDQSKLTTDESKLFELIIKNLIDIMENISSQYQKNLKINVL